jgi:hypothetical protein
VKLAVALILLIILLSLLSTLVGFDRFFTSPLFLVPVLAFVANLSVCTVDRLARRSRTGEKRRYGPDLVHIGLLALIAGGLLSFAARTEKLYVLSEGGEARVSSHYTVTLVSFEYLTYDNGTPKTWVSTIEVTKDGEAETPSRRIMVNRPLRLPGVKLYQASFAAEGSIRLRDAGGAVYAVRTGQGFQDGDTLWYFEGVEKGASTGWTARFLEWKDSAVVGRLKASEGGSVGTLVVEGIEGRLQSGLKAVSDPGSFIVIPALALILAGLALTFIQGRRDEP